MKFLILMALALFMMTSFAKTKEEKEKDHADEEYAKDICLMKDKLLRGQKLQDCIKVEFAKQREAKKTK